MSHSEGRRMERPNLGDKLRFVPDAFVDYKEERMGRLVLPRDVLGRVVYLNEAHRFFDVEYELNGVKLRESFLF